jgi:hypothetical protein
MPGLARQTDGLTENRRAHAALKQVQAEGQFVSCCAAVKGSWHTLLVVPRPRLMDGWREELEALEAEAVADPSAKAALMQKLHVRGSWRVWGFLGT